MSDSVSNRQREARCDGAANRVFRCLFPDRAEHACSQDQQGPPRGIARRELAAFRAHQLAPMQQPAIPLAAHQAQVTAGQQAHQLVGRERRPGGPGLPVMYSALGDLQHLRGLRDGQPAVTACQTEAFAQHLPDLLGVGRAACAFRVHLRFGHNV